MKNIFTKIVLALTIVLGTSTLNSCKKFLERSPLTDIRENDPYKNFRNFQGYTEELYNCIPLLSANNGHNSFNIGEEEFWEPGESRLISFHIDNGNFLAWTNTFYNFLGPDGTVSADGGNAANKGNLWGLCWYGIRKANVGLANLDKLTDASQAQKDAIAGQLYFFRAFFHFQVMQYWGGLAYIDQVLPSNELIRLPRLSYQATADKVAADFTKAIALLPENWDNLPVYEGDPSSNPVSGTSADRINKYMAMGFLAKNYLFAGSPLMNRESTGSATYNVEYCKKAADAFANMLKTIEATNRYELAPFSQIRQLIYTWRQNNIIPGLKENIMHESLVGANGRFNNNQRSDYRPPTVQSTGLKVYPTANYVDYYGMANGLPIVDPTKPDAESGYDPQYPFRNRDPRLYNDIVIDGEQCVGSLSAAGNSEFRQYASMFTGGLMRTVDGNRKVWTGYMNSKIVAKDINTLDGNGKLDGNIVVLSLMRLADVYLMYAEATANGYGTPQSVAPGYTLSAVDAVNKVRNRAGVQGVAAKFLTSTADFNNELRRERAVELAFEGHRFNDLRRWLLFTERPYTLKKAVEFDRATTPSSAIYADPKNAKVNNFRETILLERTLGQRHYWLPFQQKDVNIYAEFKQNPGW